MLLEDFLALSQHKKQALPSCPPEGHWYELPYHTVNNCYSLSFLWSLALWCGSIEYILCAKYCFRQKDTAINKTKSLHLEALVLAGGSHHNGRAEPGHCRTKILCVKSTASYRRHDEPSRIVKHFESSCTLLIGVFVTFKWVQ